MKVENDILIPEIARLLQEGKEVRFTPSGVSMRPYIEGDRDSVILAKMSRAPRIGDIILAKAETPCGRSSYVLHRVILAKAETPCGRSSYVLHRVIRIEGERIVLQGDGNLAGEEVCAAGDIIGTVIRIEAPSGRRKLLTRGRLWYHLRGFRWLLLKIYRKVILLRA